MGDFSAQAVINTILSRAFPDDPIVGEEDATDLRGESPSATALRHRIVELSTNTLTAKLEEGEKEEWGLGPNVRHTTEGLLDIIDRGSYAGGRSGRTCLNFLSKFFAFIQIRTVFRYHVM